MESIGIDKRKVARVSRHVVEQSIKVVVYAVEPRFATDRGHPTHDRGPVCAEGMQVLSFKQRRTDSKRSVWIHNANGATHLRHDKAVWLPLLEFRGQETSNVHLLHRRAQTFVVFVRCVGIGIKMQVHFFESASIIIRSSELILDQLGIVPRTQGLTCPAIFGPADS